MNALYNFAVGPLAWFAFAVCFIGLIGRIFLIINRAKKQDTMIFAYLSPKYGFRSWFAWLTPYYARNWKLNPVMCFVTFAFHIGLLIAPVFLSAHMIMLDEAIGWRLPSIPDHIGDLLTVVVIVACGYFAYRRATNSVVKYISDWTDWAILAVVALPFITGFLAYHQVFAYKAVLTMHILAGEAMLIAIPFTKLSHMVVGPMIRYYMGSEFGGVRHTKDW